MSHPLNQLESICYHSELVSQTSFLVGTFFAVSYIEAALDEIDQVLKVLIVVWKVRFPSLWKDILRVEKDEHLQC